MKCARPPGLCPGTWGRRDLEEEEPGAHAGLAQEPDRCREESGRRGGKWARRGRVDASPESPRPRARMRCSSTACSPQPRLLPAAPAPQAPRVALPAASLGKHRALVRCAGRAQDRQTDRQKVFPASRECPQPGCSDCAGRTPTSPRCPLSFAELAPVPGRDVTRGTPCAHPKNQRR